MSKLLRVSLLRVFHHQLPSSQLLNPRFGLATLDEALRRGRGQRRAILREAATAASDQLRRARAARQLPSEHS